jgi:FtsH-binding integral membrane protein
MAKSAAQRRYVVRMMIAMAGYLATLFLAEYLIDDRGLGGPLAWIVALLPGLCVAAVFWAIGRLLIEEQDEYLRSLLVRQTLVATGFAMVVATIYGFLENYRLVPHIDAFYLAVLFFIGLGVGSVVNKLTLGDSGGC